MKPWSWDVKNRVEIIAVLLMAFVVVFSLLPAHALPQLPAGDKLLHFTAYAAIALFAFLTPRTLRRSLTILIGIVLLSVAIEFAQTHVHRTLELADIFANAAGVVFGFCTASLTLWVWSQLSAKITLGEVSQN